MRRTNSSVRSRSWFFLLYDKPTDCFSSLLSQCQHYCYIYHDKDEAEPHYHLIVLLPFAKTLSACLSYFTGTQNCFGEPIIDRYACFKYLLHSDVIGKAQYTSDCLVSDDISYFQHLDPNNSCSESGEKTLALLEDICSKVPFREMVLRYGRDYVLHYDVYVQAASRLYPNFSLTELA